MTTILSVSAQQSHVLLSLKKIILNNYINFQLITVYAIILIFLILLLDIKTMLMFKNTATR